MSTLADRCIALLQRPAMVLPLLVAVTAVAGVGIGRLSFDDATRSVTLSDPDQLQRLDRLFEAFGSDENDCVVVLQSEHLFSPAGLAALREIAAEALDLPGVESVLSMYDARRRGSLVVPLLPHTNLTPERLKAARERALWHPVVAEQFLSADARTTLVIVRLEGGLLGAGEVEGRVARLRSLVREATEGTPVTGRVTGFPVVRADVVATLRRDVWRFNVLAGVLAIGVALVLFRSAAATLIVFLAPALGVAWSLGALGLAGHKIDLVNCAMPTLVFVIGFSDAVHLMFHIRRARREGADRAGAVRSALRCLALPCLLTSLTTAVGFGSLVVSHLEIIRAFGVACAAGCLFNFVAVLLAMAALASTRLGDFGSAGARGSTRAGRAAGRVLLAPAVHWPRLTSLVATAATALLVVPVLDLRPDYRAFDALPPGSPSLEALRVCDREFGGANWAYVLVGWPEAYDLDSPIVLDALEEVHAVLGESPRLRNPLSVLNVLEALPDEEEPLADRVHHLGRVPRAWRARLVRRDLGLALVAVHVPEAGTWRNAADFEAVQRRLAALRDRFPRLGIELTGTAVLLAHSVNQIILDLRNSLLLAAAVIFVMLVFAVRSVALGLTTIVPNVFPLVATAAALALVGKPLDYVSVVVFSMCLGIGVDDTIHFLHRHRRESEVASPRRAVRRTFRVMAPVLATTTLIFLTGFSSLFVSETPQRHTFAALACLATTLALVGDLVILPALLLATRRRTPHEAAPRETP